RCAHRIQEHQVVIRRARSLLNALIRQFPFQVSDGMQCATHEYRIVGPFQTRDRLAEWTRICPFAQPKCYEDLVSIDLSVDVEGVEEEVHFPIALFEYQSILAPRKP